MKEDAVYRRLLGYLKPYSKQLFIAYFSMLFATLLNLFVPQIIKEFGGKPQYLAAIRELERSLYQ